MTAETQRKSTATSHNQIEPEDWVVFTYLVQKIFSSGSATQGRAVGGNFGLSWKKKDG